MSRKHVADGIAYFAMAGLAFVCVLMNAAIFPLEFSAVSASVVFVCTVWIIVRRFNRRDDSRHEKLPPDAP